MRPPIADAVRVLRDGGLVAFPTETVYGLGANARDPNAVARIFEAKGRPAAHPLIVHLAETELAMAWAGRWPDEAALLAAHFWPGPLTLVLPRADHVLDEITGGQSTVALRVPDHPIALELLAAFGDGVAAPSANRFGSVSPTTAAHVALELGDTVDLILDGGACRVGVESTIVDLASHSPRILRPGGVSREALEEVLARTVPVVASSEIRVPGSLDSHYAPRATVIAVDASVVERTVRAELESGARVVLLGPLAVDEVAHIVLPSTPALAARRLYSALREVDERGFDVAVVALPSEHGLGLAVADRLRRASAPREA